MEKILALVALGVLVLIGLIAWAVLRGRSKLRAQEADQQRAEAVDQQDPFAPQFHGGDPMKIRVGDHLRWPGWGDTTFTVRGTATLRDGAYTWQEHYIDPIQGDKRYLSVEKDDGELYVIVWTTVEAPGLKLGHPEVVYDGVTYELVEKGPADYTVVGTTDLLEGGGRVRYWDYEGPHEQYLSFERYDGGEVEISVGVRIANGFLDIYSPSR